MRTGCEWATEEVIVASARCRRKRSGGCARCWLNHFRRLQHRRTQACLSKRISARYLRRTAANVRRMVFFGASVYLDSMEGCGSIPCPATTVSPHSRSPVASFARSASAVAGFLLCCPSRPWARNTGSRRRDGSHLLCPCNTCFKRRQVATTRRRISVKLFRWLRRDIQNCLSLRRARANSEDK